MENEAAKILGQVWGLHADIEDIIEWNHQQGDFETLEKYANAARERGMVIEGKVKNAAARVEVLMDCLQSLLNKVNVVTCEYIHQGEVGYKAMEALCARQIEVEKKLKPLSRVRPVE